MARTHPFDLVFGNVADDWFAPVREAAQSFPPGQLDLGAFRKLEPVSALLETLQPGASEDDAEGAGEYLHLLFAAYRYWEAGCPTAETERAELVSRLGFPPLPGTPALPDVVYCRLPEQMFWGQVIPSAPHEPVDGFFLVAASRPRDEWLVISILGLREEREGFSQVSVTASGGDIMSAVSRRTPPFAPAMAGGDAARFRSIATVEELLLLVRLALVPARQ